MEDGESENNGNETDEESPAVRYDFSSVRDSADSVEDFNAKKNPRLDNPHMMVRAGIFGAVEKTRTSTGYYPTATSTLRVYQFRHDRT